MLSRAPSSTPSTKAAGCRLTLKFPDMPRAFGAHELSDGTLKYLCLLGALMGYRLPSLVALNEPEASLHPSLLPPLARLIGRAAPRTRIWIVTHSEDLAEALRDETGKPARRARQAERATSIEGLTLSGEYRTTRKRTKLARSRGPKNPAKPEDGHLQVSIFGEAVPTYCG